MMLVCSPTFGASAPWPSQPVKLVVPFPPGSSNDLVGRLLAQHLEHKFGKSFIVENKPGASGAIGIMEVARAKPDGHTILVVSSSMVTNLTIPDQAKYDVLKDFEPISLVAAMPVVMVTDQALQVKNVEGLIKRAKSAPGQLSYGSSGLGSPHQLTAALFQSATDTQFLHVPYKGQNPILMDLLADRINVAFVTLGPALPYIKSGQLTAMGLIGKSRSPTAPDIPTLNEQGIKGIDVTWWLGVFAPAGTPSDIVDALAGAIAELKNSPEAQKQLNDNALNFVGSSPAQFSKDLAHEIAVWKDVARKVGVSEGNDNVVSK
jgi:tripartite-type tricarboxylate transporter receptor subunit TctC